MSAYSNLNSSTASDHLHVHEGGAAITFKNAGAAKIMVKVFIPYSSIRSDVAWNNAMCFQYLLSCLIALLELNTNMNNHFFANW